MRIACLIQARTGSMRLPNKINADIGGWPMIKHVVYRAESIRGLDEVRVIRPEDFPHIDENDVLARYMAASTGFDAIMRLTGDCPLIDPRACEQVLNTFRGAAFPYVANDLSQLTRYPDGMGCEVFERSLLIWADKYAKEKDREHVTPWIIRQVKAREIMGFHIHCPLPEANKVKFSVDTQEDLDRVRAIDFARPASPTLISTWEAYGKTQNLS